MADQDGVAYCPARVDLLSHIQYSNFADIQYLQIHNSEDEAEEGEQAEEYAEGSDMGEYGFDEDLSDVESIEDAPLEDDPAPIPNITEGDRSEVKEDREIRSEKPEKPKEPGEDKQQPKKTEPISPAPKKAKNARKKEESKKKDKERPKEKLKGKPKGKLKEKPKGKEKVTDKSEKSKPKTGKSNDAPKDAKRAAATMETHPAQEPLVVAETPPADDRPNELPPAAADAPPAASHDGKEAEPTPPPESATKEQTEKEMKEDPPQEGVEIHAPPNEPTADKLNEAASGPEQEHKKEGHNSALVDPNNEASNNEPDEKGSGPIPEPEKELDTPPVVESPNESNEKQSSQETSSKPEDSVITKASGEPPLSKGLESATTESTTVLPQESTGSGETRPADAPESEGSGETTARAPSVPADEPRQVPNISPEKDLANEDTSSHPPEKTSSTTEPLPEVEAASNGEKAEDQTPAVDPVAPTAEESEVENTSVESTQTPPEHGSDSVIEKEGNGAEDPTSSESNEAVTSPDLSSKEEVADDDDDEKQKQEKAPVVELSSTKTEQASTSIDTETSHELVTPEESTGPENSSEVSVKSSDDTLDKPQAMETSSTEEAEGDTNIQPAVLSVVDSVAPRENIDAAEEDKVPKTDEGSSDVSAGDNTPQSDVTSDSITASKPGNGEPGSEPSPQSEADKPLTPDESLLEDQHITEQTIVEVTTSPENKTEDDKETLPSQQYTTEPTHIEGADTEPLDSESQIVKEDSTPDVDIEDTALQEHKESSDQPEPKPDAENIATTLVENQGPKTEGDGGDRQGKDSQAYKEVGEAEPAPDAGDIVPQPLEEPKNSAEAGRPAINLSIANDASPGKCEPQDEESHSKIDGDAIDNEQTAEDPHSTNEGSDGDKGAIENVFQSESVIAASASNKEETVASAGEDKEASGLQEINADTEDKQPKPSGSDVEGTTPPIIHNDSSTEATGKGTTNNNTQPENVGFAEEDPSPVIKSDDDTTKGEMASDTMGDDSRPATTDPSLEDNQSTVKSSPLPIGDTTVVSEAQSDGKGNETEPPQEFATENSNVVEHEPAQNGDRGVNKVETEVKQDEGGTTDPPEKVSGNKDAPEDQEYIDKSSSSPLEIHDPPDGEGVKGSQELEENINRQTESENPGVESEAEQSADRQQPSSSGEADSNTKDASLIMNEVPQEPRAEESSSTKCVSTEAEISPELKECPEERTKPASETNLASETAPARENPTAEEISADEKALAVEAESVGEMTSDSEETDVPDEAPTTEAKPTLEGTPAPGDGSALKESATEPAADEACHEEIHTTENPSLEQTSAPEELPPVQGPGSVEVSIEKDADEDSITNLILTPKLPASDAGLSTEEPSEALKNMAPKEPTTGDASAVGSDVQDEKTGPVIESVDEATPPADSGPEQAAQVEPEAASEEVSEFQPDVENKEQAEAPVEAESGSPTGDDPKIAHSQMDKPKALGKTTPIAETEETKKEVTLEDSKSHEDSTSNELAETPTEPEKGTVAAFPSEQLTIGNSKAEGLDETIEVEDTITREEQEDVIESQEPVEETARLEEASSTGEQAPSADTKDGAPFQVADTATPEAKDTKVESPGSNDAVIEPEQPKESAFVEATKPGEESSSQRTENSSVALEVVTTTDPGVINESEVPKEVSEPAAVTETIPSQSSEQDKKESSAASNVQGQPQIVKDDAVSTDYDPASPDPKTGTEEKAESPQSETVKENPDSAEPIVEVKEEASSAPSQVVTASDGGVETLGETAPVAIFEVRTDCPPLKPTGDPAPGLSTKELIERKIQTHQMQEDDECKDTVGPTPREEIAARRASKGEEQSVPGCVRDSPGVIENDFGEIAPELVIGNVLSEEEGLEEERGSNEGEPGDKPTAGVQETALLQPDDSQGPGIPKVQENKSTGPKINPEDSQHPLEDVSQEAVEGRPAEDTVRQAHQLISPGEDQIEPAHHLVEDTPEISENDKGQVMGNSQEFANKLHSQPREIMITDISEGVTLGESSTGPQCEDGISETAESPIDTAQTLEANEPVQDMEPVANNETQEPLETKSLMETTEVPNSPSDEDVHTSRDKDVLEIPVQDEEVDDNGSRGNAAPHKDTELIMQDIEPELDSGNSKEAAGRGIAAGGGSTQTSMGPEENPPTESKASGDYAASSSKHRQEDPVASEEGQPGPTPTKTLIEDSSSGPEVDQEFSETQPSTQSHSSGPGLGFESLADVAQAKTEPKTTSTSTTEVKSATGQNEDVSQQLPLSLNNASQKDPPQREMNRDSYTKDELKHETSDNAIAKDSIPEIVAEPEQIASVALHSSEQYVEDTSHLVTITENTDPKSETPDTTESTSIQEEYEASMPQPVEDENEEQILGRAKKPANDEPVLPSDIQDPERTITSSLDGVDSQVLSSISSQKSTNNEVSSAVEEPIVENPERVEGQSSEDRDEHIQKSTLPPPTDHVQELTIQKLESIKSSSDQSRVEMPAQEHVGVCLAKSPIVKASTPEETIVQVPDEATKALLVESHETIPPSVEKPEESRPTQLEEHAPRQPPSDNKLISAQKSTSVEESNVVEETRLIKDDESDSYKLDTETVGKVEGKSSIEPPTVANDTEASDQLHVPNSSESGIIASSSTDADDDFVLVERSDKDVPKEPILETQEPESVTLGQSAPIKEKQEAPLHYPVKEAIPETEDSDGTHTNKEGQTESEVNELVASSVTDKMDSAGHGTCEDLSNLSPESVVMLESSVEHGSEAPESPVIIDKAHPATENDSDESSMSMSGSHVIIEREIDQSDDHGGIPVKGVQGHKEPKQTRNSDSEQIQPLVESPQREKLNSGVSSEQLQAQGEVPFKPVDTRQADASDKDPDNDSESTDEARVDVIGSEVAGTAMIAAGSAMLALKPSAISESARSSTTIQKVVSEDDVERGDGSSLGRVPSERTVEYLPVAKSEHASAETHKAAEMSKEVPDSSPQESPKNTEAIHTPPQVNSSDDSQPTEKNLSPVDDVVTESIAEKTNQKSLSVTSESPELVSSNTPLSESFRVIDARPMNTKRSRHDFFPALVHSGTQTDEDLDFASLWDRNLQCFFDLANMEPRSSTPGVVIPDLSDSQAKAFGRARSVKKQRRQSYKRAEATVAAAVIIYAASQQLGPRQKEMLGSHQAKDDDGKEMKTSQEPTQEPHDISSGVAKARSVGRKEVSIADLSTDESSRSHHSDRHHRHRHHRHHHSEQSRDNNNSDEHHHYHHRRHRRHRSSNPPVESYSDHSISRKRESEHSVDSSHGHPSRRHRTAEEQAAHERRKAERQSRESYDVESRSKPREAPRSDRQSYHSSTRSSRSHSEPHPPPVNTEAPVVTPTKTSFDTKGHMVIEPNHAPRPKTRDTKDAPRPTSRDMRDVPRPVSRDTRNAPVRDYSRTEPSRHSVQVPRPRRNSMDVRSTADARNSVDLSRSKSHRRYREEEDGSRRHRKDEPRADPSSTAAPPSVPRATPELRDEPRHTTRREERQRVREAESQRKPSSTGFRASLKKLFT